MLLILSVTSCLLPLAEESLGFHPPSNLKAPVPSSASLRIAQLSSPGANSNSTFIPSGIMKRAYSPSL